MENDIKKRKQLARWIIGIVAACILLYLGVRNIGVLARAFSYLVGLVSPLIIGLAIALVLNVPMGFLESHLWKKSKKPALQKLRRPVAYVLSLIVILGIIVGLVWLVIPELVSAIKILIQSAMELLDKAETMDWQYLAGIDWQNLQDTLQNLIKTQGGNIMGTAVNTVGTILGGVVDFVIAFIFSIYILFNKETLKKQCARLIRAWLPKGFGEWLMHASSVASGIFRNFVSGQTLEAIILGTLCMIGMFIFRIPYAPMVGALVGVTAMIPVVGAFTGAIVGAFLILSESPIKALFFLIFLLILQQLEGNLIYPKVMGSRVNLPAMWVLAAVTIGGGLAGPIGMLLGVPLASTVYVLVREATEKRERAKKREKCLDEHSE